MIHNVRIITISLKKAKATRWILYANNKRKNNLNEGEN